MKSLLPASFTRTDFIALIVASTFFMEGLDATIIAPAIPEMARSFGTSAAALSAGISAYLIAVAVFIPVSGWAADRCGVRSVYCVAIATFVVASVLCGLSTNLTEFVIARVLQGIGGAMMSPVGRMEVLRKTPKDRFLRAMAMVSWPGLTSFMVGPPLGGFITTYVSWNWIFFINVPLGLIALALVFGFFGNDKTERRPFDWTGFALNGSALGGMMYGLDVLGHGTGDWMMGSAMFILAAILGIFAVRHALRHPHPLISLAPLRVHTFAVGTFSAASLFRMTIGARGFLLPIMFQIGFGFTAFDAGLLLLAFATGDVAMKLRATYFVRTFGVRRLLIGNGLLFVVSIMVLVAFTADTPFWLMSTVMFIGGMFQSQQFTALSATTFSDIASERMANATALANMLQQVGFAVGVALGAIFLVAVHNLAGETGAFSVADFRWVIGITSAIALISVLFYLPLHPHAASSISGHRAPADEPGAD
jgi:EmrB/QacA subfamily drug resistance transporter